MPVNSSITKEQLDALARFDTCTVSNAVETFQVRLRNTGFAGSGIRCIFEDLPPMVGFAATACLRTGAPPMSGGIYHERSDWWKSILQVPAPRIVVMEDMDEPPGVGAFLGDVHAAILKALGCVGYVTDGAVRELPGVREQRFHLFAGNVAVSHAYAHIFDLGSTVNIGGLEVKPGDLLHGDLHGLLNVPKEIAAEVPAVAAKMRAAEQKVLDFCRSSEFSIEHLPQVTKDLF